jgi:esterase/lipase superfamily enzyme
VLATGALAVRFLDWRVGRDNAQRRAAQIGYDLQIRGAMSFFSWPSQGTLVGYPADEATIDASEAVIAEYLVAFAANSGAERVHLIAHSMGNRGLLRAVNRLVTRADAESRVPFGHVILAAPDVDRDVFLQLASAYRRLARRTTLYVSDEDRAVGLSRSFHGGFARVGYVPPVTVVPEIDTVHVANVDLTALGHGYIAEARDVLHDMFVLIKHDAPPTGRMGLRSTYTETGEQYWVIGK